MKPNFKIIIPSYNNEQWVEYNIASILNQTYNNYQVLYINDASTDNTFQLVHNLTSNIKNWKIVSNKTNERRGYNVSPYNTDIKKFVNNDEDILVFIDGDDWLYDETVLQQLADAYLNNDFWMTYGKMVCYPSEAIAYPQNTEYTDFIINNNLFRKDIWRASHLRTFKWGLYKKIKFEDLVYTKTGKYYFHAEDLATSFPCLEMCPKEKIGVLDFYSYVFNETQTNRSRGIAREKEAGQDLELEIRNRIPYNKIKSLYD